MKKLNFTIGDFVRIKDVPEMQAVDLAGMVVNLTGLIGECQAIKSDGYCHVMLSKIGLVGIKTEHLTGVRSVLNWEEIS